MINGLTVILWSRHTLEFIVTYNDIRKIETTKVFRCLTLLTCVGLAFNFGKLILVGFNCNVDGLHGVGGNRLPCPLRATNTG